MALDAADVVKSPGLDALLKYRSENELHCADCGYALPEYVSVTFGVFLCQWCAGTHRSWGTHISRVRHLFTDDWTPKQSQDVIDKAGHAALGNKLAKPSSIPVGEQQMTPPQILTQPSRYTGETAAPASVRRRLMDKSQARSMSESALRATLVANGVDDGFCTSHAELVDLASQTWVDGEPIIEGAGEPAAQAPPCIGFSDVQPDEDAVDEFVAVTMASREEAVATLMMANNDLSTAVAIYFSKQ